MHKDIYSCISIKLTHRKIISSNVYVVLNRNFHSNVNVLGRFYKHSLTSLYRSTLFDIFLKPYSNKGNSLKDFFFAICQFKDLFCNIKDNAWKKDNEKYVINILWHEIFLIIHGFFHIGTGVSPRLPYQSRQRYGDRYWLHR